MHHLVYKTENRRECGYYASHGVELKLGIHEMTKIREQAIEYIQSLSEADLVEFCAEALKPFKLVDSSPTHKFVKVTCLAQCTTTTSWIDNSIQSDGPPDIDILATIHPSVSSTNWGDLLSEFGHCPGCGLQILSVAKTALCPMCESKVYCT